MSKKADLPEKLKLQVLFENNLAAILITQPDGVILEVNSTAEKMFGYSLEEFRKLGHDGVIDPESPGLIEKFKELDNQGTVSGQFTAVRKGGKKFQCDFSSSICVDESGEKFIGTLLIDISGRIEPELKSLLEQESDYYKKLFLDLPAYICILEGRDYRFKMANAEFERLTGRKDYIGKAVLDVFPEVGSQEAFSFIVKAANTGTIVEKNGVQIKFFREGDGLVEIYLNITLIPYQNLEGEFSGIICFGVEVTKEVQTKKMIEESNERFRYVTRATSDAIWDFELKTGKLIWGEGYKTLFGYHDYEQVKEFQDWKEKIHPDDAEEVERRIEEVLLSDSNTWQQEYRFLRADGFYDIVLDKGIVMRGENGKPQRLIGAVQTITEQKLSEHRKTITSEIHRAFNKEDTVEKALERILKCIQNVRLFTLAEYWMVDRDEKEIILKAFMDMSPEIKQFYEGPDAIYSFKKGEGLPGETWEKEESQFWRLVDKKRSFKRIAIAKKAGILTVFSLPVFSRSRTVGVLLFGTNIDTKQESYYFPLMEELAEVLGLEISRKQLENELSLIFESVPDIICIAGLDGYFKKVNPAMCDLLGYTEQELLMTPIVEFIHPDDRGKTVREFEALRSQEGNTTFENRYITKNGKVVWLSWTTKPFYDQGITFSVARDVSEQKKAELAFKKLSDERVGILERIGDGFFAVDRDFTVTYWNNRATELLHMPKESIIGKHLWDLFSDALENISYKKYHQALEEQVTVHFEDYFDRLGKWFEVSAYPSTNGLSVFFKDITERKASEDLLRELNQSLEQQARELATSNADLEQFAFVASHDLQEPLRMITGFLKQLESRYEDVLDEKGKKYIHFATDGAKRMRQIILDLLEYSRVGRLNTKKSNISLTEIVEDVMLLNKKMIQETKAVITYSNLPTIWASKSPFQQLLQNLIINGLQYQQPGNVPEITISAEELKNHWKISVRDNGIGIHPDHHERVFLLFQRLHSREDYSGTGLGLAICKKVIEDHNGEIWVESEEGKGSTFHFTIEKRT